MGIARREACSTAADIYSAGVLLAEVVTGLVPFLGVVGQTDDAEYRLSMVQQAKHQAWVSCFLCHVSPVSPQGHLVHLPPFLGLYTLLP